MILQYAGLAGVGVGSDGRHEVQVEGGGPLPVTQHGEWAYYRDATSFTPTTPRARSIMTSLFGCARTHTRRHRPT